MQADRQVHKRKRALFYTYRAIQLSFVIHPQIESTVHPSNAYQAHRQAYEFQNTCKRITQLFKADLEKKMKEWDQYTSCNCYFFFLFPRFVLFFQNQRLNKSV